MSKILATCFVLLHFSLASFYAEARSSLDGRILAGQEVDIQDYPYQVSVEYNGYHICGGAIIDRTWILSAAHCVAGLPYPDRFTVRVGTSHVGVGGQLYNVSRLVYHSNYSTSIYNLYTTSYNFDIALLQLVEPIEVSISAQIVGLSDEDSIVVGASARMAGWGATFESGYASPVLRAINIEVFSQAYCRNLYSSDDITDTMFCAGASDGVRDACYGDDGGPLISSSRLIGIFSWGLSCARPQNPGVYTNVIALRDWIREETGI